MRTLPLFNARMSDAAADLVFELLVRDDPEAVIRKAVASAKTLAGDAGAASLLGEMRSFELWWVSQSHDEKFASLDAYTKVHDVRHLIEAELAALPRNVSAKTTVMPPQLRIHAIEEPTLNAAELLLGTSKAGECFYKALGYLDAHLTAFRAVLPAAEADALAFEALMRMSSGAFHLRTSKQRERNQSWIQEGLLFLERAKAKRAEVVDSTGDAAALDELIARFEHGVPYMKAYAARFAAPRNGVPRRWEVVEVLERIMEKWPRDWVNRFPGRDERPWRGDFFDGNHVWVNFDGTIDLYVADEWQRQQFESHLDAFRVVGEVNGITIDPGLLKPYTLGKHIEDNRTQLARMLSKELNHPVAVADVVIKELPGYTVHGWQRYEVSLPGVPAAERERAADLVRRAAMLNDLPLLAVQLPKKGLA